VIINLYKHRGYIWRTALAEVRNRYAGAGLGVVWNFIQPLAMILIFTLIFTKVMTTAGGGDLGAPYPIYLCAAMLPWSAFGECLNRCTNAFVANAIYLRKLPIPEHVFVAQAAMTSAINLGLSFVLLLVVAMVLGHEPTWHWALLPIPMTLLIALGFGAGLFLGTLNAFLRDIGQVLPIVLQLGFWSYPIVYKASMLPRGLQAALPFNPIYPAMESIRILFIRGDVPGLGLWLGMVAWAAAAGGLGYLVLRKLRRELRDVI
jgi:ABC-type polysaccharide/polyol phosphate export permease